MSGGKHRVVLTIVGRKKEIKDLKKARDKNVAALRPIVPPGELYCICEKFDTYLRGGLYPFLHYCDDTSTVDELLNSSNYLDPDATGDENILEQGVYEEVANITPGDENKPRECLLAMAAFKSMETKKPAVLIQNWKNWTGARAFIMDINNAGLNCYRIRFLVRIAPSPISDEEEPVGFMYVMLTEVEKRDSADEARFIDVLQKFRVERWFGYQTIYKQI